MPFVITANRLADGVVVFQSDDCGWSEDFNRAAVQPDNSAVAAALERAKEDEARNLVVDVYETAVEERNGRFALKALREAIRAAGPTVRLDLGKQAQGHSPHAGPRVGVEAEHVSL